MEKVRATPLVKRITFGEEGTPLLERAHQTLPSRGGTPDFSSPREGTPDFPGEGTPDGKAHQTLGRAHQTLPSWRGHTRPLGRAHQTLPTPCKQHNAWAGARLPIRGQVLVSAWQPQKNSRECTMLTNISHRHTVPHSPHTLGDKPPLAYCCTVLQ